MTRPSIPDVGALAVANDGSGANVAGAMDSVNDLNSRYCSRECPRAVSLSITLIDLTADPSVHFVE